MEYNKPIAQMHTGDDVEGFYLLKDAYLKTSSAGKPFLSAVLAAKDKKAAPICALVALASLGSYWETALPLSFCALMMFAALILTLRHTQREENVI